VSPARLPIAGRAGIRDAAGRPVAPVLQHDTGPGAQAPASPPGPPKYLTTRGSGRPTRITVDLAADLHGFLRGYAQARDAAAADIVRELIRQLRADPDLSSGVTAELERRREALAEAVRAARD
jgi:hypothetical protein